MGQKKLLKNSLSLLVNRLTQGFTTFVISAAIARNLGAHVLGQYLLAISYYYIFVNLFSQGLKTLFTRELARNPKETPVYLVSGSILQLIFSIVGYVLLVIVVFLLPYASDTSVICYILGLTIVPFALSNITEAIFQAQEKMYLIAVSTVPVYILRLVAMLWVMQLNYGIKHIAGILVISEFLVLAIEWLLLIKIVKPQWQINPTFMWDTTKNARTFFAIEGIGIIASKTDVLIISLLGSELFVGLYGAVGQLMQPFFIIASSLMLAAFPGMSKAVDLGREQQRQVTENIIEMLLCMALPFLVGLLFFGNELLIFVYQEENFLQANIILRIISLTLITSIFSRTFSYVLIANGFEKFNLIEVVVTTVVGGLAGIVLVSQFKLVGAAFMSWVMAFTNLSLLMYAVYSRLFSLRLWRVFRRPLIICGLMSVVLFVLKNLSLNFFITLMIATCFYLVFASLIAIYALGGYLSTWQKISNAWNKTVTKR